MNFEELTRQVGFPLAVVIHSQQVPIDDDFWDNVTFDQWQEVRHKLPNEDHVCNEYVLNRMRQRAQIPFGLWLVELDVSGKIKS